MKLTIHMVALLLSAVIATAATAREAVVGLSPNQSPEQVKAQVQRVVEHLVATVEPGERAHFFDADGVRLIGTFKVPDREAYKNPRAKLQANRKVLQVLKRFIDRAQPSPGREGHINLPGLLRALRKSYPTKNGADLIVLGSAVFADPKSPSLSMQGAHVPNNGHIVAHAGRSPFGTTGLPGSLEGYNVYFGDIGPDWAVSPSHAYQMERFWSLSVEGHGASLQFFGDDLATLFGRADGDAPERKHAEPIVATDKLEMLHFAPDTADAPDIYSRPLEQAAAPQPVWRNAKNVRVGITWHCMSCDLDVYLRPSPGAKVIFYGQASTSGGRLYKDYLNSPSTGFETVALNDSVDLSTMRVAVNHYGGRSNKPKITGEIRIAIGRKVWAMPFTIRSRQGNRGAGAEIVVRDNTVPNAAWTIIDPMDVVKGR